MKATLAMVFVDVLAKQTKTVRKLNSAASDSELAEIVFVVGTVNDAFSVGSIDENREQDGGTLVSDVIVCGHSQASCVVDGRAVCGQVHASCSSFV